MRKKILFILNSKAGLGKADVVKNIAEKTLLKNKFDYTFEYTSYPGHASEMAKNSNAEIIVAVGGDGTVNEVAKELVNTKKSLAIIPTGSGNGLARYLKIPLSVIQAITLINKEYVTTIDTGYLNTHFFCNIAGVGFDAYISKKIKTATKRGFWAYVKLFFKEYFSCKEQAYQLNIDEQQINIQAFLISFANGAQYGNNAYIAPKASVNDGCIEVCVLKKPALYYLPVLIILLFTKKIAFSKHSLFFKAKKVQIKCKDAYAHVDGESVEINGDISVNVTPSALKIMVP